MADARRTLDYFLNSSTGVFKDSNDISAQMLRDFTLSAWGTDYLDAAETADFTGVVGYLHPVDLSGAGSDFEVTFPGSPVAGDVFGFFISVKHATSAYCVQPAYASATKINSVDYSATKGKWSLWLESELLIFRYVDATVGWQVVHDGRIPQRLWMRLSTDQASGAVNTVYSKIAFDATDLDNALLFDAANSYGKAKRTGTYSAFGVAEVQHVSAAYIARLAMYDGSAYPIVGPRTWHDASDAARATPVLPGASIILTAAQIIALYVYQDSGGDRTISGFSTPGTVLRVSETL